MTSTVTVERNYRQESLRRIGSRKNQARVRKVLENDDRLATALLLFALKFISARKVMELIMAWQKETVLSSFVKDYRYFYGTQRTRRYFRKLFRNLGYLDTSNTITNKVNTTRVIIDLT